MLILTRKQGEEIVIGDDIILTVTAITPTRVRIGIEAPEKTRILRGEIYEHFSDDQDEGDSRTDAAH